MGGLFQAGSSGLSLVNAGVSASGKMHGLQRRKRWCMQRSRVIRQLGRKGSQDPIRTSVSRATAMAKQVPSPSFLNCFQRNIKEYCDHFCMLVSLSWTETKSKTGSSSQLHFPFRRAAASSICMVAPAACAVLGGPPATFLLSTPWILLQVVS